MDLRSTGLYRSLLLLAVCSAISLSCAAQAASAGSRPPSPSRVDLFAEYTYFHPFNSGMFNQEFQPITGGLSGGVAGYVTRSFGIQGEYTYLFNHPDYCVSTIQGGPVFRHQMGRLVPFLHAMGGVARVGPSYAHSGSASPCSWGWVATGGLGLDYILPTAALGNHVALRLIEGDFHYSDVNYSAQTAPVIEPAGEGQIKAYRLSAGVVFRFGDMSPNHPASFGCEVEPVQVFPGDPITVTGRVIDMEESKKLQSVYSWSSNGGRITGSAGGATVNTSGMAAGDYVVTGRVTEGAGPAQHAECTASFRVVAYAPPTIACSASPNSILTGGIATITAVGRSPQNRPLSYSYGTSAGQITGTGNSATLAAADVRPGTVNVTCNVVDDKGNSASANTAIAVVAPPPPPPPPAPSARYLCSIAFERDRKHPVRVDNEAKACLDDIAVEMNREPNAVLVVVGKHDAEEKPDAAAERTLNVKQYMTDEKGIAANRIEVRTGETAGRTVDNVLVPPGATWDAGGTTSFDPSRVERHGEPYAPAPRK